MRILSVCETWLSKKRIYTSWILFPVSFSYSAHAHYAVNLINNLPFACLYEDCFRYLTAGNTIKHVLQYLLFPTLSEMLQQSRESLWEFVRREPKTQQRRCTESCSHDTFVLEKGIYPVLGEARSEISASALQLGTVSAGGKAHHRRLIKDLYPFRRVFSHFFCKLNLLRRLRAV